ncbi:MAG: Nre family DNA repair protein [Promethearchaeota archaeon]
MVKPILPEGLCIRCKGGRHLCGKNPCPILLKYSVMQSLKFSKREQEGKLSKDISSQSPPSFFVGHQGYPRVRLGPMLPHSLDSPLDVRKLDSPEDWIKPGSSQDSWMKLQEIVKYRSSLVRTIHPAKVRGNVRDRILDLGQQIAMAEKPVGTEVELDKLRVRIQVNNHAPPTGPTGNIENLSITENPKVHRKVEQVVSDTDLKAGEAMYKYMYTDGHIETSNIQRILSAGLLGIGKARRLVPTRWSITAVDDTISKELIKKIKYYPEIGEYKVHYSTHLGNSFHVILVPRPFMYEMMECWDGKSIWRVLEDVKHEFVIVQDHEFNRGRKKYASNVTGAYYAARLGVCEHLVGIQRQATAIVIREVNEQYLIPLGVWVIRQVVRDAMSRKPATFSSMVEVLRYLRGRLQIPLKHWLKKSDVIKELRKQKTLLDYLRVM